MKFSKKEKLLILAYALLAVLALIFLPMIFIWSLNCLFNLGIELTWKTWASALALIMFLNQSRPPSKN